MRGIAVVVLGGLALAGCAAGPASQPDPVYTLAVIRTGPRPGQLSQEQRTAMFQGHFANMNRLAREGHLVMAGPYGQQKSATDLRGLFVLDTADPAVAQAWAETDPGFQQGEFRFEYHRLETKAALRAQLAADLAREDEFARRGEKPPPGAGGRGYVWLVGDDHDRMHAALAGNPAVLLLARLDGGGALVLLDAVDQAAALTALGPAAAVLGAYRLDEWYGSGLLVELPKRVQG